MVFRNKSVRISRAVFFLITATFVATSVLCESSILRLNIYPITHLSIGAVLGICAGVVAFLCASLHASCAWMVGRGWVIMIREFTEFVGVLNRYDEPNFNEIFKYFYKMQIADYHYSFGANDTALYYYLRSIIYLLRRPKLLVMLQKDLLHIQTNIEGCYNTIKNIVRQYKSINMTHALFKMKYYKYLPIPFRNCIVRLWNSYVESYKRKEHLVGERYSIANSIV